MKQAKKIDEDATNCKSPSLAISSRNKANNTYWNPILNQNYKVNEAECWDRILKKGSQFETGLRYWRKPNPSSLQRGVECLQFLLSIPWRTLKKREVVKPCEAEIWDETEPIWKSIIKVTYQRFSVLPFSLSIFDFLPVHENLLSNLKVIYWR